MKRTGRILTLVLSAVMMMSVTCIHIVSANPVILPEIWWHDFTDFLGHSAGTKDNVEFNLAGGNPGTSFVGEAEAGGNVVMHFTLPATINRVRSDGEINSGFRKLSQNSGANKKVALAVDFWMDNTNKAHRITFNGAWWNLYINPDGTVTKDGGGLTGSYRVGEWNKLLLAMDFSAGAGHLKVFLNGEQLFDGIQSHFVGAANITNFIYAVSTTAGDYDRPQEVKLDNFGLVSISDVAAFTEDHLDTRVTSELVQVDAASKRISGYGTATVKEFLDDAVNINELANASVYTGTGILVETETTPIEPGMTLKVTAPMRGYETVYTFGSAENELRTEIMKVKGNKKAIYTITMDDGYLQSTRDFFEPWFEELNLRGTTLAVYDIFKKGGTGTYTGGVSSDQLREYFEELLTKGNFQIDSHSVSHINLNDYSTTNGTNSHPRLKQEIINSRALLQNLFPEQDVMTYTPANNVMPLRGMQYVRTEYGAMRTGNRSYNDLNTLSLANMYNLNIRGIVGDTAAWTSTTPPGNGVTETVMKKWIDDAISGNHWVIDMWHTLIANEESGPPFTSDGGYGPVAPSIAKPYLEYLSQKQADGDIWVATFSDAVKYQRERLAATISDNGTTTDRIIKLTDTLNNKEYDYPLTLRSEVPSDWDYATVTQNGRIQNVTVENGCIYYDAIPDQGNIMIEKSLTAPASGVVNEIKLLMVGEKNQDMSAGLTSVTIQADIAMESGEINPHDIAWYVNGTRQNAYGTIFKYMPYQTGKYGIVAVIEQINGNGDFKVIKSTPAVFDVKDSLDVDVTQLNHIVYDDFERGLPAGSVKSSNSPNWGFIEDRSDRAGLRFVADPKNGSNIVALYTLYVASQQWPFLRKRVTVSEPFVISGKTYVNYTGNVNEGTKFFIGANNMSNTDGWTSAGDEKLILFNSDMKIYVGGTKGEGNTPIGEYTKSDWVRFDLLVTPNVSEPAESTVKAVITGSGLKNKSGVTVDVIEETVKVNLTAAKIATIPPASTPHQMAIDFAANLVQWNGYAAYDASSVAGNQVYLEDVKIYTANSDNIMYSRNRNVNSSGANVEISFNMDINPATFNKATDITVTDQGGEVVIPDDILFNPMNPNRLILRFETGKLKDSSQYTVSIGETVNDMFGRRIRSEAIFITERSGDLSIDTNYFVKGFAIDGGKASFILKNLSGFRQTLQFIEAEYSGGKLVDVKFTPIVMEDDYDGLELIDVTHPSNGNEIKYMLWEFDTYKPVILIR